MMAGERLAERIDWRRTDVTEHNPHRADSELVKRAMGMGMVVGVERHLFGAAGFGNAHMCKINPGLPRTRTLMPRCHGGEGARRSTPVTVLQSLLTSAQRPSIGPAETIIGASERCELGCRKRSRITSFASA